MKAPYPELRPIIEDGDHANVNALKNYLEEKWYKAHSGLIWHNTHSPDSPYPYLGYWSFESAALVKMFNLDDSSLIDVPYYPYDFAHFGDVV